MFFFVVNSPDFGAAIEISTSFANVLSSENKASCGIIFPNDYHQTRDLDRFTVNRDQALATLRHLDFLAYGESIAKRTEFSTIAVNFYTILGNDTLRSPPGVRKPDIVYYFDNDEKRMTHFRKYCRRNEINLCILVDDREVREAQMLLAALPFIETPEAFYRCGIPIALTRKDTDDIPEEANV